MASDRSDEGLDTRCGTRGPQRVHGHRARRGGRGSEWGDDRYELRTARATTRCGASSATGGTYESAASTVDHGPRDGEPLRRLTASRAASSPLAAVDPARLTRRTLSLSSPTFGDFPDAFRGWVAPAVRSALEVIDRERVDAICSLCPPATAHVVAAEVARRTGLPWVAQFDDLYSFHLERQRRAAWRPVRRPPSREWMRHATLAGRSRRRCSPTFSARTGGRRRRGGRIRPRRESVHAP
jgi:hypothetical protein